MVTRKRRSASSETLDEGVQQTEEVNPTPQRQYEVKRGFAVGEDGEDTPTHERYYITSVNIDEAVESGILSKELLQQYLNWGWVVKLNPEA